MNPQRKTRIDARARTTSTAEPKTATGTNKGYCRFIFASCGWWDCATPNTVRVTATEMVPIRKSFGCKNLAKKIGLGLGLRWHTHSDWLIAVMFARDIIRKPPPAGIEEEISNSISFEMKSDNLSAALTQDLLNTCYQRHFTGGIKVPLLPLKYGEFSRDKSI